MGMLVLGFEELQAGLGDVGMQRGELLGLRVEPAGR